ncbi:MAG: pyrroline-5-carboxylate reductase [Candidatus Omnitrophica bacterium]|nr:pyrroline-5-carboxylate reductase [Candidatus Omnitrophota bacterium]
MKKNIKIGVIGFGNMGSASAEAISAADGYQVLIYDQKKAKTRRAKGFQKAKNIEEIIRSCQILILTIKPQDLDQFLRKNQNLIIKNKPLLVSFLAGVAIKTIEAELAKVKVVRVMPNLAIKVKEGLTFIAAGSLATKNDLKLVKDIFSLMGEVIEGKEMLIDKITALSGSGPGFIYYFMESFYKTAIKMGFKKKEAKKIVAQTFKGASLLASDSNKDFFKLLSSVASPGGTTEAGISFFNQAKLSKKVSQGIYKAHNRAKKISSNTKRRKS